jgi:hypothetical protein
MEGAASIKRDGARGILDANEVAGRGTNCPPYDRDSGIVYSQAVITQMADGRWKMFVQSDRQVEMSLTGSLDDIVRELRFAATRKWERRGI